MFCPNCGTQATNPAKYCGHCGQAFPPGPPAVAAVALPVALRSPAQPAPPQPGSFGAAGMMLALGSVVGGAIGFVMRPSVMLIGQLPFETVITRGSNLSGIDQILVPTAQSSFNVMLIGALIGAAVGFGLGRLLGARRQ